MKHVVLSASVLTILAACPGGNQGNNENYWNYSCSTGQHMGWIFKTGERGRYQLDGGSILKPINPNDPNTLFMRQDGVNFRITGNSGEWVLTNLSTGRVIPCKRTV